MYTLNPVIRRAVAEAKTPEEGRLIIYRRIADMLSAMEGSRSWTSPWSLITQADMLRRYDIEYNVFPTDLYTRADRRQLYATPPSVDHELLHYYNQKIEKLEGGEGPIIEAHAHKTTNIPRLVRFAPGT